MSADNFLEDVRLRQEAALYRVHVRQVNFPTVDIVTLEEAYRHCLVDTFEEGSPPATVSDSDAWLTDIGIPAAREYCEAELGIALATRTVELTSSSFPSTSVSSPPGAAIPLPFGPVQSIESVTYLDQSAYDAAYDTAYDTSYDTAYQTAYDAEFGSSADPVAADAAGIAAGTAAGDAAGVIAGDAVLVGTMPTTDYAIDITTTPMRLILAFGASWPTGLRSSLGAVTIRYVVGYSAPADSPQVYILPRIAKAAVLVMLTHLYEHRGDESIDVPPAVNSLLARVPGREAVPFA